MLVEHISSMQGLYDTHKEPRAMQVELAFKKIIHQLNLLQKVWKVRPLVCVLGICA